MYRGEGILKEILTESDRDLGRHSFLSVKVTWAITRHIDEHMCSLDWRSVVIFHELHAWKSKTLFVSFIEAYGEFKVFQIFTIIIGARFHGLHVKWIHLGQTEDELKLQILIRVTLNVNHGNCNHVSSGGWLGQTDYTSNMLVCFLLLLLLLFFYNMFTKAASIWSKLQ